MAATLIGKFGSAGCPFCPAAEQSSKSDQIKSQKTIPPHHAKKVLESHCYFE
jgi:hypothetical protein